MRVFLGMIFGAMLTVLFAYTYDSLSTGPSLAGPPAVEQKTMVNWDVVGQNWLSFKSRVQNEWIKLSELKT
jgi:hypothetical protein